VIQKEGDGGGRTGAKTVGAGDKQGDADFGPSPEAGESAVRGIKGWAVMTQGKARACSLPLNTKATSKATPTKTFAVAKELERKRGQSRGLIDQVVAL
jgi:hypothetical protein